MAAGGYWCAWHSWRIDQAVFAPRYVIPPLCLHACASLPNNRNIIHRAAAWRQCIESIASEGAALAGIRTAALTGCTRAPATRHHLAGTRSIDGCIASAFSSRTASAAGSTRLEQGRCGTIFAFLSRALHALSGAWMRIDGWESRSTAFHANRWLLRNRTAHSIAHSIATGVLRGAAARGHLARTSPRRRLFLAPLRSL